jgi:hypothetical protein
LSTIDVDIKSNPLAFNVLKNFVANMILVQVEGKPGKINYERIISEIVDHIMTSCIGYKAASLKPTKKALMVVCNLILQIRTNSGHGTD